MRISTACSGAARHPCYRTSRRPATGFMLLDMLVSLAIGMLLLATIVQMMVLHSRAAERISTGLRDRINQRRTLHLIRSESNLAEGVVWDPSKMDPPGCSMAGRTPLLQLKLSQARITYSIGPAPSAIWQPQVLMRCGPAFALDGTPSSGANQHRVVLDRLDSQQLAVREREKRILDVSIGTEMVSIDATERNQS